MKKMTITLLLPAVIFPLSLLLAFVSIRGENDKLNAVVQSFFRSVQEEKYAELGMNFSRNHKEKFKNTPFQLYDQCFFMELALLEKYNLLDETKYDVEIKRSHFWIPYVNSDIVGVNIAFTKRHESLNPLRLLSSADDNLEYANNIISMTRENGRWKIDSLNFDSASIASTYTNLRAKYDIETFMTAAAESVTVNGFKVDAATVNASEKRVLKYALSKAASMINDL